MRRREISPEFWTDERVVELSDGAKLLFIGLWNMADRDGRLEDKPRTIGFKVRPWDPNSAPGFLAELAGSGLISRYVVKDLAIIAIPKFGEHQHVHPKEQPGRFPPPEAIETTKEITSPEISVQTTDSPGNYKTCRSGSSGSSGSSDVTTLSSSTELDGAGQVAPLELELQPAPQKPTSRKEQLEAELTDDEFQVFAHWKTARRPGATATPERKRIIAKALKAYSVEDLQRAIDGLSRSPHHMGQNERHQVYDDIELVLRDAKRIESFMALASPHLAASERRRVGPSHGSAEVPKSQPEPFAEVAR